jgi:hypothetical protein
MRLALTYDEDSIPYYNVMPAKAGIQMAILMACFFAESARKAEPVLTMEAGKPWASGINQLYIVTQSPGQRVQR